MVGTYTDMSALGSRNRIGPLVMTASAAGAAILFTHGVPDASAQPCPDTELVFARGTGEPPGVGPTGQAFVSALSTRLAPRPLSVYAVDYPATDQWGTGVDGIRDAGAHVVSRATTCPQTKMVLGGYSQGAAVIDMLAGVPPLGNKIGSIGSAPPLPGSLQPNIAAVVVFGNPAAKFDNPITSSIFAGRALDLCKDGDPICSGGRNPFAHNDYVSGGQVQQAANFAAGLV